MTVTKTTADAPVFVNSRLLAFNYYGVDRAYFSTITPANAFILICLPDEIGRHQDVSWYFPSLYATYIPAGTTTAIAVVFYAFYGIINEMYSAEEKQSTLYGPEGVGTLSFSVYNLLWQIALPW